MSSISVDVDIDIDDIVWSMSRGERRDFFLEMQEADYISDDCEVTTDGCVRYKGPQYDDNEFNKALFKLIDNGWKLKKEDEEYIINISKQF
jgi:hypothetical protein